MARNRDIEDQRELNRLNEELQHLLKEQQKIARGLAAEFMAGGEYMAGWQMYQQDSIRNLERIEQIEMEISSLSKERKKVVSATNSVLQSEAEFMDDIASKMMDLTSATKDKYGLDDRIHSMMKMHSSVMSDLSQYMNTTNDTASEYVTTTQKAAGLVQDILTTTVDLVNASEDMNEYEAQGEAVAEKRVAFERLKQHYMATQNQLSDEQNDRVGSYLNSVEQQLVALEQSVSAWDKTKEAIEHAHEEAEKMKDKVGSMFDGVQSAIEKVPGGKFLMDKFGFDEWKSGILDKIGGSFEEAFASAGTSGLSMMQQLGVGAKSFGMALISGPQAAIFGTLAVIGLLVAAFMEVDGQIADIGKNLNITYDEASKVHEKSIEIANSMNLVAVGSEEVAETLGHMNEVLPGMTQAFLAGNEHAKELVETASMLEHQFGLSSDQIGKLNNLSAITGESVSDMAAMAGTMGEKTIGTKEAMEAMAEVPAEVAVAFKGSTKELAKAAIQAKALGMSLGQIQSIGDDMLDIESSLSKEMEARMLTGKNINLDRARELALNGDIAGLQEELLSQAGSLSEFQGMNRLAQQSFAEAMGMSVEEMTEMLSKQEELNKIGMSQNQIDELMNKSLDERQAKIDALRAAGQDEAANALERMSHERESASATEKIGAAMSKLKDTAVSLLAPVAEFVNHLLSGEETTEGVSGAFSGLTDIFKTVGSVLKGVFDLLSGYWEQMVSEWSGVFNRIKTALQPVFDLISDMFGSGEEGADGMGEALSTIGKILGYIGGFVIDYLIAPFESIALMVGGIIKLFKGDFVGALEDIGMGIVGFLFQPFLPIVHLVEDLMEEFGLGTSSIEDMGKAIMSGLIAPFEWLYNEVLVPIGDLFTDIGNSILDIGKFVFNIYKNVFLALYDVITMIGKAIWDTIVARFEAVWDIGKGIVQMFTGDFMGGLETIGQGIYDFFMAPIVLVKTLFHDLIQYFLDKFNDFIQKVKDTPIIGSVIGALTGGGDEEVPATVEGAAAGGTITSGGVVAVGEQGPELVSLPTGATVANAPVSEQIASFVGQRETTGGATANMSSEQLDKVINLLQGILNQTSGPQQIVIGNKVITELTKNQSLRKNAVLGLDNTYGVTV